MKHNLLFKLLAFFKSSTETFNFFAILHKLSPALTVYTPSLENSIPEYCAIARATALA